MDKRIYVIGLNHKTAPVEIREAFALTDCEKSYADLFPVDDTISEVVVLSTCNRVEITAVGNGEAVPDRILERWAAARGRNAEELRGHVYIHQEKDAVRHIFSVAASLDSMVVGEPQILGQLKQAYKNAVKQKMTKVICNRLLHKSFAVAKRIRTETSIGTSAVSISYAAVELAKRIFGEMTRYKAMLIGAGEMAELAAQHLLSSGIKHIYVANRTFSRAVELAEQFNGSAVQFNEMFDMLDDVDIVISSTGAPQAVLHAKDLKHILKKRKNKPMFFIDIAVPRDIDPDVNNLDNIYLYDIDDLKEVVEENMAQRREEATRAASIVESETATFCTWLKSLDIQPTIVDLLKRGEDIAGSEIDKTVKRLHRELGEIDSEVLEQALAAMSGAIVRKLLHDPIVFLKQRVAEESKTQQLVDYTRRLFQLDEDRTAGGGREHGHNTPPPANNDDCEE